MEDEAKTCKIVNAEGGTMVEVKQVKVEDDHILIVGALMGAWDTDMYLDLDSLKAAISLAPIPELLEFVVKNVLNMKISQQA